MSPLNVPSVETFAQPHLQEALGSSTDHPIRIYGHVSPGFEAVQKAFAENFTRRHELGGACCAYYRGEKVVDLWGGMRNRSTGRVTNNVTVL